jgi:hypothetical protein
MAHMENTPKPDFRSGFALNDLTDGGMVVGRVDTEEAILLRSGDSCSRSAHTARTTTDRRRRPHRRRHRALSLASRVLQPAHR